MPTFRKKPVEIQAVKYLGGFSPETAPSWIIKAFSDNILFWEPFGVLNIRTLEGIMQVSLDDYIIQGVKGEIYPCKPDIFELTYDEV